MSVLRLVVLLLLARPALADDREPTVTLAVDLPVTIGATAVWLGTEAAKNRIGPATCRWCDTPSSLNAFDRAATNALAHGDRDRLVLTSDLFVYAFLPALTAGLELAVVLDTYPSKRARRYGTDVLLILESAATAASINQLVKFSVARRRPDSIDDPVDGTRAVDQNLSYFSNHATLSFAVATSAGMLATLRRSRLAPLVWVLGLTTATGIGMLRIAGEQHFASDVVTGALVGSAVGFVVPLLHRSRLPFSIGGAASRDGGLVMLSGRL